MSFRKFCVTETTSLSRLSMGVENYEKFFARQKEPKIAKRKIEAEESDGKPQAKILPDLIKTERAAAYCKGPLLKI